VSDDPYNAVVREMFSDPQHAGAVDDGTVAFIDDQGVRIRLSASVRDGRVAALRFLAWGCPHTIAAAEAACRQLEGAGVEDLVGFSVHELMQTLAVPAEKSSRILVVEDAVRSLGNAARSQET
jgi:NifU-like protein involved in Fe-S cluster formation